MLRLFSITPEAETAFLSRNKIRDSPGENRGEEIKSCKGCISSLFLPLLCVWTLTAEAALSAVLNV